MTNSYQPQHLNPSALGTKEYWDDAYSTEIKNHSENPEDVGVIWFSDSSAEEKILEYLEHIPLPQNEDGAESLLANDEIRILDLGTGNGHLLFALQDEGWQAQMVGVDYSLLSVELARRIHQKRMEEVVEGESGFDAAASITFEQFDILGDEPVHWLGDGFDIVLDKGTFDAVSLNNEADAQGRRAFENYGRRVEGLLKPGGFFLITSCNWTGYELRKWFESSELAYHDRIRYPSYTFGGVQGQTVSSICFQRRSR